MYSIKCVVKTYKDINLHTNLHSLSYCLHKNIFYCKIILREL